MLWVGGGRLWFQCLVATILFIPHLVSVKMSLGTGKGCDDWKWKWSLSVMSDSATLWTIAHQALLSMGFSMPEYWSGLPFPSPGHLPDPGIEPRSLALQADTLTSELPEKPNLMTDVFWIMDYAGLSSFKVYFVFISQKIVLKDKKGAKGESCSGYFIGIAWFVSGDSPMLSVHSGTWWPDNK